MPARRLLLEPAPLRTALHSAGLDGALPAELFEDEPGAPAAVDRLHPAVLTALALLVRPDLPRVVVRAGTPYRRRLTVLAVGDGLGTSLARDLDAPESHRPVEQSVFPDAELGAELARCLPPLPVSAQRRRPARGLDPALLLLAAGADPGAEAAAALEQGCAASLEMTVSAGSVVNRLIWVHAGGAWWQPVPTADAAGNRLLDLRPVVPRDLLPAAAPLLAAALATSLVGGVS